MNDAPAGLVVKVRAGLRMLSLATVAALAGCGGLNSNARPDQFYVLNAAPAAGGGRPAIAGTLLVPRPRVQPGLDTFRIALMRPGNELDYFAASRWGESLPQVLDAFVVQSMAGSFDAVGNPDRSVGPADFELVLTARHFEANYSGQTGAPVIRVAFDCTLAGTRPRRLLGSCDSSVDEPAADNRMSAIVAAFERAAQRALGEIRGKAQALAAAAPPVAATGRSIAR